MTSYVTQRVVHAWNVLLREVLENYMIETFQEALRQTREQARNWGGGVDMQVDVQLKLA